MIQVTIEYLISLNPFYYFKYSYIIQVILKQNCLAFWWGTSKYYHYGWEWTWEPWQRKSKVTIFLTFSLSCGRKNSHLFDEIEWIQTSYTPLKMPLSQILSIEKGSGKHMLTMLPL